VRASSRLAVPLFLLLAALLSWASLRATPPVALATPDDEGRWGNGWLEDEAGVRILHLSGTPYEMGFQQGVLLRDEIRDEIRWSVYQRQIQDGRVSHLLLLRLARGIEGHLSSENREEMAGLAEGAGVSYTQVLLLNTYEDVAGFPWSGPSTQSLMLSLSPPFFPRFIPVEAADGGIAAGSEAPSTWSSQIVVSGAFSIFGLATSDAGLIQTAEFAAPLPSTGELVVVQCEPDTGNSFVAVRRPGRIGVTLGLNEERVTVSALPSPSQDVNLEAVPLPFVIREVLQYAGGLPEALRIVASAERTTGQNVLIGDGKGPDAKVVECSAHQYAVFDAENDFVARTNHFFDPALRETQVALSWWNEEASWEDLEALLRELERGYGSFGPSEVVTLVQRLQGGEQGGCPGESKDSVAGVLMDGGDLNLRLVTCDGRVAAMPGLDLD
jgi:hypothetical protein